MSNKDRTIGNLNPNKVLVIAPSGFGKSYSSLHLPPSKTVIICPDQKAPPFRGWKKKYLQQEVSYPTKPPDKGNFFATTDPSVVLQIMDFVNEFRKDVKFLVIDTITALMMNDVMYRIGEMGWDKWNELAVDAWQIIRRADNYRDDLFVFILAHTDPVMLEKGKIEFFVPGGNLMKTKVRPEIYFTTVLEGRVEANSAGTDYYFYTQTDGTTIAKSPPGLFGTNRKIPNDLMLVARAMRAYDRDEEFDMKEEIKFMASLPEMPDSIPARKPKKEE